MATPLALKSIYTTQIGVAKETTYGTAVAATNFLPVTKMAVDDKVTYIEDKAWRGSPVDVYGLYPGPVLSDVELEGPVFPDTIGFMFASILGGDDVTGTAAPYSHVFTLNNTAQPPSYTVTDSMAGSIRQAAGLRLSGLDIKIDAQQLVTYTAKGQALMSASTTAPTASYSALKAPIGWQFTPSIGGTAVNTVQSAEVNIARTVTPVYTLGQQSASAMYDGLLSVSGKMTTVLVDESPLTAYLNGTQQALDLAFTTGTGSSLASLTLHCSQVVYKAVQKERSKDYAEWSIEFSALANTTDIGSTAGYSPMKVTLQNAQPSGTYA